jgi:hypothetical protein
MPNIARYVPPRREDWELNHVEIMDFVKKFCERMLRMPTKAEVAAGTGLNYSTVQRHFRSINKNRASAAARIFGPEVAQAVAVKALAGDMTAARLFFQYVLDWNPKEEPDTKDTPEQYAHAIGSHLQAMRDVTTAGKKQRKPARDSDDD